MTSFRRTWTLRVMIYSSLISFALGVVFGAGYCRQLAWTERQKLREEYAILRQHEWAMFTQHVRDDRRLLGTERFQFPTVEAYAYHRFAMDLEQIQIERHASESYYVITVRFKNIKHHKEIFSPTSAKLIDESGMTYEAYQIDPTREKSQFSPGATKRYRFVYHIPSTVDPKELILIGPSGISQFSLRVHGGPFYDPYLQH